MRSNTDAGTTNPLTVMRKTTSLALLLLGGCATAGPPRPAAVEAAPVPVNIRPLGVSVDSAKPKRGIVVTQGACQTNDPMPTAGFGIRPRPRPELMPGMRMDIGSAPMPNACPVIVPRTESIVHHAAGAGAKRTAPLEAKIGRQP